MSDTLKLIIEIPKEMMKALEVGNLDSKYNPYDVCWLVRNGIPLDENKGEWIPITLVEGDLVCNIPKGMTNGEVIQALFPSISVYEHGSTYSVNNEYNFNSTWWNALYQKGDEQ